MSAVRTEAAVGAAVVAVAIGFLVYASQFTNLRSDGSGYALTASFRSIEGVSVGTDVRLAGVKIGTVTDITLNPATFRADAEFSVADGVELPDDSAVVISSEGLSFSAASTSFLLWVYSASSFLYCSWKPAIL